MTTTDPGTYVEHDGRPAIRFVRTYRHSVARVWAAISEPAGLAHWFPSGVTIEPRVGGAAQFDFGPRADPETGTVLVYDPPRGLAYSWGGDELHFTVEPTEEGCTLTLVNVLEARDTAARNGAGWSVCLVELAKHLDGDATAGSRDSVEDWRSHFAAAVAAGLPAGAAIPGQN